MKFSLIVPVYNVEKYIDRCLKSIEEQSYRNFEVIIVNDGTKDQSQKIINRYVKKDKRFKSFIKENGGLSDARNYGLDYVQGDYIIFIDSDDYINTDLLQEIIIEITKNKEIDIVKSQVNIVNEKGQVIKKVFGKEFNNQCPKDVFMQLTSEEMFEPVWLYAFKTKFWKENNFTFAKGRLHEDFGLLPYVIIKANHLSSIPYYGYNYVIRNNSIITSNSRESNMKKANDILYHFDNLLKLINEVDIDAHTKKVFRSFIANEVISKAKTLSDKDLQYYIVELKKRKVTTFLVDDTIPRKLKKWLIEFNLGFYVRRVLK